MKKMLALVMTVTLLLVMVPFGSLVVSAEDPVKISKEEYNVFFANGGSYLCNALPGNTAPGTEYFLTYTVDKCDADTTQQQGIVATGTPELAFPYANMVNKNIDNPGSGFIKYDQYSTSATPDDKALLKEGYTYFFRFTINENGFSYVAARAKDDFSEYFLFDGATGEYSEERGKLAYFGLWFAGGGVTAQLSHVRFYDRKGNDLGIDSPRASAICRPAGPVKDNTALDHKYNVEVNTNTNLALSNEKALVTEKMFMEYTVVSNKSQCNQSGVGFSDNISSTHPHTNGYLLYDDPDENQDVTDLMMQEGAHYNIIFQRTNPSELRFGQSAEFGVMVQITKDGKTTYVAPVRPYRTSYNSFEHFFLWFGEGKLVNVKLVDLRIYDENGNNLGLKANSGAAKIEHIGELTDYSNCDAVYYCEKDDSAIELFTDKTAKLTKNGKTTKGTYNVNTGIISFNFGGKTERYDFLFSSFTNTTKTYKRLYSYTISFVTGNGTKIKSQTLSAQTGFIPMKPTNPKLTGCQFLGWVTGDGKEFKFGQFTTKSVILYAKWSNDAGIVYIADKVEGTDSSGGEGGGETIKPIDDIIKKDYTPIIAISIGALLLIAAALAGLFILKGDRKNDSEQNS